jgi:hypothetical protein
VVLLLSENDNTLIMGEITGDILSYHDVLKKDFYCLTDAGRP